MMRWLLFVLALTTGRAYSQNPIPSEAQKVSPPKQQAKHTKNPSTEDQRGTEKQPLFVKIIDAPNTKAASPKDKKKSSDKPPFIWGMTAEEFSAISTFLLVIVGALTALVLIGQSYFLRRSVNLSRKEFNATHRPRIRIRNFSIFLPDGQEMLWPRTNFAWGFNAVNVGDSDANIVAIIYSTSWTFNASDAIREFEIAPKTYLINAIAKTGTIKKYSIPQAPWEASLDDSGMIHVHVSPGTQFFVIGRILYRDSAGLERNTGFFWKVAANAQIVEGVNVFRKVEDTDYEYED
jgi:hypothetical protein